MIRIFCLSLLAISPTLLVAERAHPDSTATSTTLEISLGGGSVTSVESHTAVTLTATVKAGSSMLKLGQVRFCNTGANYCEDSNLLGTAQLTSGGTATMKTVPGIGSHSYKAVFVGTHMYSSSSSATSALSVNGSIATTTSIGSTGREGAYTLTAAVAGLGTTEAPAGLVFFQDKSDNDAVLGQGSLGPVYSESIGWKVIPVQSSGLGSSCCAAVADFNNDGFLDYASAMAYDAGVSVLLSNGDGSFNYGVVPEIARAQVVTAADFNADGKTDLAVISGDASPKTITILNGNGDGSFTAGWSRTVNSSPSAIVTGDFNGDGKMDLATADFGVHVFFGKGDGTFSGSTTVEVSKTYNFRVLLAGDFNGDGETDLFTIGAYPVVLYGHGDGTFTFYQKSLFLNGQFGVLEADFNNDGLPDVAIASYDSINLLFGNTADKLVYHEALKSQQQIIAFAVNDFNLDGHADVALESYSRNNGVEAAVELGDGKGDFRKAADPKPPLTPPYLGLSAADFNGDGLPDLLSSGEGNVLLLNSLRHTTGISVASKALSGAGTHHVVARYQGDETFDTSGSRPLTLAAPKDAVPVATLSTLTVPFADQPVGEPSNAKTVTLANTGTASLNLSSIAVVSSSGKGASFASSNDCPASLVAGATCKIRLRFVPGSSGDKASTLVLTDNAGNSPQSIALNGQGVDAP